MLQSIEIALPGSILELVIFSMRVSEADLQRFAGVFTSVWEKIDREDRKRIDQHWSSEDLLNPPRLELQLPWGGDEQAIASTGDCGTLLKFDWKTLEILPDHVMQVPIAHEMGHVYQWAIGKNRLNMTPSDLLRPIELLLLPRYENTLVEIHADQMVERWGFDPVLKDAYLLQRYDLTEGKYIPRSKPWKESRAYNEAKESRWFARYNTASV